MTLRSRPTPTLPPDLDHVRGLRVARWLRESTPDQMDYYGPAAQTRVIEDAIKRFGLRDTGIGWTVAASGWKRAWLTLEWQEMLAAAREGRFDVLLVAYQSRFLRNVKQTLIAIEDQLHPAGVAIFFIDEGNLSSDPDDWHAIVEEATDAERYSRRMAKRQREGHAAKRRTGEPGGRPPFGFRREGKPPILVEMPERIDLVRQVFAWSASGLTDRQVAERAQLRKTYVSELLSNRFYAGELSDGARREPPVIDSELWSQVQEQRSRHARRHPGPVSYRLYRLGGLLACRNCGRLLTGHCGRYRHTEACVEYRAARPGAPDGRVKGESYSAQTYEDPVREAVGRLSANRGLVSEVQAAVAAQAGCAGPDRLALVRVARRRREAADRLTQDRDMARWQAEMEALDVEEAAARAANHAVVSACEVVEYLADLPQLYDDAEPETQKRILQSLIERVEVLGPDQLWIYPTDEAEARGLAAAFAGEFRTKVRQTGRGERASTDTPSPILLIAVTNVPSYVHRASGIA